MTRFTPGWYAMKGARVEYGVKLGRGRDECGRLLERIRPTQGDVLHVDESRGKAWVLLDGETEPRFVPLAQLGPGAPRKKGKCPR